MKILLSSSVHTSLSFPSIPQPLLLLQSIPSLPCLIMAILMATQSSPPPSPFPLHSYLKYIFLDNIFTQLLELTVALGLQSLSAIFNLPFPDCLPFSNYSLFTRISLPFLSAFKSYVLAATNISPSCCQSISCIFPNLTISKHTSSYHSCFP